MFTAKKSYRDLPAAHRQPTHAGHCRLIHGHNWGFDISFSCDTLDKNGFVIDVGELGFVKQFLVEKFDHTLLLNEEDVLVVGGGFSSTLGRLQSEGLAKIVPVPNCGMEGLAKYVFEKVNALLVGEEERKRGVQVIAVTCYEDSKNSATFFNL